MSHVVSIATQVRDLEALRAACRRLQLAMPKHETVQLFSSQTTGFAVHLLDWRYPVVCTLEEGRVEFDNYGGRWGRQQELDRLLQSYAAEKTHLEARKQGHSVSEQALSDGSIKLTVQIGAGA